MGRAVHLLPGHASPRPPQLGPWWQYRPADAKKLLAEAGHPNGFQTTLFYYEYYPQMTSQIQLVQQDLKRNLNIDVKISKLDYTTYYGRYVDNKWDGMAWGFQSGHAIGVDERTYQYVHSKSTKNFFPVNDPVIDELTSSSDRRRIAVNSGRLPRRSSIASTTRCCGCGCPTRAGSWSSSRPRGPGRAAAGADNAGWLRD